MGNQLLKYILILLGAILLLSGSYLFMKSYANDEILILNTIVSCTIYFANIFTYPSLYASSQEFSRHIAGLGVSIFFVTLYTILGIAGIIAGLYFSVSFEWQLLYQLFFLLIYLGGLFAANMANSKINNNN